MIKHVQPGALLDSNGICHFTVWAPQKKSVAVKIISPVERDIQLVRGRYGYFSVSTPEVKAGALYYLVINGILQRPDPASQFQPSGVHGPSQVVSTDYGWTDGEWKGIPADRYIFYELHTGAFSAEGTFAGVKSRLEYIKDLGVTAVELMPVAQFPGSRNWGYDGVYPFAVQNSYGGPQAMRDLVNACHERGLAVVLDVVYNHLGPEGNYFRDFAPYFSGQYHTPWGESINFDGEYCDGVRNYFIQNALYWIRDFHIDALRLDAVHAIYDSSPVNILEELTVAVHSLGNELGRRVHVFAESNANDTRLARPRRSGGYNLDAIWNDDFHHALHVLLTGERSGYYGDYGKLQHLKQAYARGFVYAGQYAPFWKRRRGRPHVRLAPHKFVVFSQNHDQTGNRIGGDRLSTLVAFDALKLAAASVILSPFLPLIFMGEEYAEESPFLYFADHSDRQLIEAVRRGRREEFSSFKWKTDPPDPMAEETFRSSVLKMRGQTRQSKQYIMLRYYRELISMRQKLPALRDLRSGHMQVTGRGNGILCIDRHSGGSRIIQILNFGSEGLKLDLDMEYRGLELLLDSSAHEWGGEGSRIVAGKAGSLQQICVQSLSAIVLGNRL